MRKSTTASGQVVQMPQRRDVLKYKDLVIAGAAKSEQRKASSASNGNY